MKTENELYNNIVDQLYSINQSRISAIKASKELFSYASNDTKMFPLLHIASETFWALKDFPLPVGTEILASNQSRSIVIANEPVSARDKISLFALSATVDVYTVTSAGINPISKQPIEQIKLSRKNVHCGSNLSFFASNAPAIGSILKTESGSYFKVLGYAYKGNVATAEVETFTPAR